MRTIPIDVAALGDLTAVDVSPKMTRLESGDGWSPGPQKVDAATGLPVFEVSVLVKEEGSRPELELVAVPSAQAPVLPFGGVTFEGLIGRHWAMGSRSGVSFSAAAVRSLVPAQGQKRDGAA